MKPRAQTALGRWMQENMWSDANFAVAISSRLPGDKRVSESAVRKWRLGVTMPRKDPMIVIGEFTQGAVTAESFLRAEGP